MPNYNNVMNFDSEGIKSWDIKSSNNEKLCVERFLNTSVHRSQENSIRSLNLWLESRQNLIKTQCNAQTKLNLIESHTSGWGLGTLPWLLGWLHIAPNVQHSIAWAQWLDSRQQSTKFDCFDWRVSNSSPLTYWFKNHEF